MRVHGSLTVRPYESTMGTSCTTTTPAWLHGSKWKPGKIADIRTGQRKTNVNFNMSTTQGLSSAEVTGPVARWWEASRSAPLGVQNG